MSARVRVTVEVVTGSLISYDDTGAQMFLHQLRSLHKLAVTSSNKTGVFYVLREVRKVKVGREHLISFRLDYYQSNVQDDAEKLRQIKSYKCFLFILDSTDQASAQNF